MRRFPRPRGDGPEMRPQPKQKRAFSPPTRGWPVTSGPFPCVRGVFPAHAGMARRCQHRAPRILRFPRPRGDGPHLLRLGDRVGAFSPPTRGWPAESSICSMLILVFPAHAGMARPMWTPRTSRPRFPRPRGDGPCGRIRVSATPTFSPPTRGWPGQRRSRQDQRRVFPAHAGMARRPRLDKRNTRGFPRPRGDGPSPVVVSFFPGTFSPPTRGWPATALPPPGFPLVFPAHAGMARRQLIILRGNVGFPRPRGDGPENEDMHAAARKFSPPTRGWPACAYLKINPALVFPAHAGMARSISSSSSSSRSFPRPRGDGPVVWNVSLTGLSFSPPTRGWPAQRGRP